MKSIGVILLTMALLISTLSCAAQDPIPFNELAHSSSAPPSSEDMRAGHDGQTTSSTHTFKRRHWTKGGKIMTFIGIPVMAAGGAAMGSTLHRHSNPQDISCLGDAFVLTGDIFLTASGIAVTAVGTTRRSTE